MLFHQSHNSLTNYNFNAFFYTDTAWESHFHKNLELICVLEGSVNCIINGKEYTLFPGDYGLCLSYDIHSHTPSPGSLYWVLVFSEDYISYLSNTLRGKHANGFSFRCKDSVNTYLRNNLIYNDNPSILSLKSCSYAFMEAFLDSVALIDTKSWQAKHIAVITDFIQQNHTNKLALSDVAMQLGYEYNYMSRLFKNTFNMPFSDFVNIYRLETALTLLEKSDKSITDVAVESGFQSVRNFNVFFKRTMNTTPSEYKKTLNK